VYAPDSLSGPAEALGQPTTGASISFGQVWLPLIGRPPPPGSSQTTEAGPLASTLPAAQLVSDGTTVWTVEDGADVSDRYALIGAPT
jgi:hypothetical protein